MSNNLKQARRLLDEGMGCLGMISEVRSKSLLLKNRLKAARRAGVPAEQFEQEVAETLAQMRADLARYSRRLKQIYEELQGYGIVPKLD